MPCALSLCTPAGVLELKEDDVIIAIDKKAVGPFLIGSYQYIVAGRQQMLLTPGASK
jgi:hypothetical protein